MSTKKFNDSGKIYRFKVMQFDVWEQWGVPRPGAERPFGNPSVTAKACHLPHRGRQGDADSHTSDAGHWLGMTDG